MKFPSLRLRLLIYALIVLALYGAWLSWSLGTVWFLILLGISTLYIWVPASFQNAWLVRAIRGELPVPSEPRLDEPPLAFSKCLRAGGAYVLAGLGLCAVAFFILEFNAPFFFSQDDNIVFLLPTWLASLRSLFSGILPVWNPFQGGGEPILDGANAVLYPFTILAYAISRFLLRNEFATLEVFALIHVFLAFLGGYWAARQWNLSRPMAAAVSLCFALSGFVIITGRAWILYFAAATWLPFLLGLLAPRQQQSIAWRWGITFALVVPLSYYTGFSQIWVFALLFYGLALLLMLILRVIPFRAVVWHVPAALFGLALLAPLLYVQMDFAKDVVRVFETSGVGPGIPERAFLAMLVPPPLVRATAPEHVVNDVWGQYYYINPLYSLALCALAATGLLLRPSRTFLRNNVLFLMAVVALFLALGLNSPVPVIRWLSHVPWLCKFRSPWRYYAIFELFAMFAGALAIDRFLSKLPRAMLWRWCAAGVILLLTFHALSLPKPVFLPAPARPYPPLPARIAQIAADCKQTTARPQRLAGPFPQTQYTQWLHAKDAFDGLTGNLPSVWGILSFNRYNTLTWFHTFARPYYNKYNKYPAETYRAYGIRWIVRHKEQQVKSRFVESLGLPEEFGNLQLWEVKDPSPMAFSTENPSTALPVHFSLRGVEVDTQEAFAKGGSLVINVLAWPNFRVYADENPVAYKPDEWGRILADVLPGTARIEAVYSPPFGKGMALALVLAGLGTLALVGLLKWQRWRTPPMDSMREGSRCNGTPAADTLDAAAGRIDGDDSRDTKVTACAR